MAWNRSPRSPTRCGARCSASWREGRLGSSTWPPGTRSAGPAISRHLRVLGEAGLVAGDDRGRERHYRLDPDGLGPVTELVAELTGRAPRFSERALDGLDLEVRRTVRDRTAPLDTEETA